MTIVLVLALIFVLLADAAFRQRRMLHMLQLDSYSNGRLTGWIRRNPAARLLDLPSIALFAAANLAALAIAGRSVLAGNLLLGALILTLPVLTYRRKYPEEKKPLVFTSRAIRIYALAILLTIAGCALIRPWLPADMRVVLLCGLFVSQLGPLAIPLANLLLIPVQYAVNTGYLMKARRKLRRVNPIVIGVAGSFGKTSTKYFLETILRGKFPVLKTPNSFNTILGICKVINGELQPRHQYFIVEMGAYRRGEIAEICRFVRPKYGVITSIGPEHMERFKTFENIEAANYELMDALPDSGAGFFNCSSERCARLADRPKSFETIRYSLDRQEGSALWAENARTTENGTALTLVDSSGARADCTTQVLGRHSLLNIVGAAAIAHQFGMSLDEIARAVPAIEPAPHRLQLSKGAGGVKIIDDSYNSNPEGAREALAVLGSFEGGKKILVTPGMVELGTLHEAENELLGERAAGTCDFVVLVGRAQTQPIARGLKRAGFAQEKIRVVRSLTEAQAQLAAILRPGDTVLFENDLPDLYVEEE